MIERFADTSGWAAWADRTLQYHELAVQEFDQVWKLQRQIITTEPVLAELTALLTRPMRMPKGKQIELIMAIRSDPFVKVISLSEKQIEASWELWRTRPDKLWSFVDCSSFIVMQQLGLIEALTTDHHFEQAGLVRILK